LLVMFAPAGMERFFEGVAQLPSGAPDPEVYRQIAHGAWMEVTGPPMSPGEGAWTAPSFDRRVTIDQCP